MKKSKSVACSIIVPPKEALDRESVVQSVVHFPCHSHFLKCDLFIHSHYDENKGTVCKHCDEDSWSFPLCENEEAHEIAKENARRMLNDTQM